MGRPGGRLDDGPHAQCVRCPRRGSKPPVGRPAGRLDDGPHAHCVRCPRRGSKPPLGRPGGRLDDGPHAHCVRCPRRGSKPPLGRPGGRLDAPSPLAHMGGVVRDGGARLERVDPVAVATTGYCIGERYFLRCIRWPCSRRASAGRRGHPRQSHPSGRSRLCSMRSAQAFGAMRCPRSCRSRRRRARSRTGRAAAVRRITIRLPIRHASPHSRSSGR